MSRSRFQWDQHKAASNLRRHRVSFEEAQTVFDDLVAYIFDDQAHSIVELREIIIGYSSHNRLLLVCFTERAGVIRIFSARPATRKEHEAYEGSFSD